MNVLKYINDSYGEDKGISASMYVVYSTVLTIFKYF